MEFSTIIAFIFSGVALLLCAWLILTKQKILTQNKTLQDKIFALEAKSMTLSQKENKSGEKDKKIISQKMFESPQVPLHSAEVLQLRKENSKLKDDLKKSKEEIRHKEKALKEEENLSKNKLFSLTEENSRLIAQMREMDVQLKQANSNLKTQIPLVDFEKKIAEISHLKDENSELKQKLAELDKIKKQNSHKLSAAQEKVKVIEQELHKWTETAKTNNGKPLDAHSFLRWHDRAVSGRKMYKLMRQMRELSDSKVSTYQDGITALSQWVLQQKNITLPPLSSGEVLADRLLAEAWNAILPSNPTSIIPDRVESSSSLSL
ncbi:hypothetical protein [Silvanigrella aquatica]|uniref:Uncharacterized protein n=1 Tax=Silvanigrella aquatica TaxID=1915309 RepID=A0A1L4D202_9BACT|nr:hypothetical protein [Silvanigrella aquatica]APJ04221.1 hypothetical protein AXG55_10010 [Silvanigrella aquatica]